MQTPRGMAWRAAVVPIFRHKRNENRAKRRPVAGICSFASVGRATRPLHPHRDPYTPGWRGTLRRARFLPRTKYLPTHRLGQNVVFVSSLFVKKLQICTRFFREAKKWRTRRREGREEMGVFCRRGNS